MTRNERGICRQSSPRHRRLGTTIGTVVALMAGVISIVASAGAADAAVNRTAITSYNRMSSGAPYNGYFNSAWQSFVAQSDTITTLGVTVGTPNYGPDGHTITIKLCTDTTCSSMLGSASPAITNYGTTLGDIGDIPVTVGQIYYIVWYQPAAWNGQTWNTYWWAGGSSITTSDQMQAIVQGYDQQPAVNRTAVTSYNQMNPGAPHNGYFQTAWQNFTAQSNTITSLGVTVGTPNYSGTETINVRLCADQNCNTTLAQVNAPIVNYGDTQADIGDISVTSGATYYIVWYQPAAWNGQTWNTYWWAGGSTIATSDQMQAIVEGYNRATPVIPTYHVLGTGGVGLKQRTGPGLGYSYNAVLLEGSTIQIACQLSTASAVGGSTIWDQLANGYYVSDFYTDTPVYNGFSPGIGQCGGPPPPSGGSTAYAVKTNGLPAEERTGPGLNYPRVGELPNGAPLTIMCQWHGYSTIAGTNVWDQLGNATWMSDALTSTPMGTGFAPGLSQCASAPPPPAYEYPIPQSYGRPGATAQGNNPTRVAADPVNTLTGAYWTQDTDAKVPSIGVPFTFERSYTSINQSAGLLGPGWTDTFATNLAFDDKGNVTLVTDQGAQLAFAFDTSGLFTPAPGVTATLSKIASGYQIVQRDQTRLQFDTTGHLSAILDRNGQGLHVTDNASGNPANVTTSAGKSITFGYNATNDRLTAITLPDGRITTYGYTGGLLTTVTDPTGAATTYTYDGSNRLTKIVDANGNTRVQNVYGSDGRVSQQTDPRGNVSTFAWNAATQTATLTDARGGAWQDIYNNNVLVARIDPLGRKTTYSYDGDLNVTSVTDPRGNASGATAANYTTTYTYDSADNKLTQTAPAPLSYAQSWSYDAMNDVLTSVDGRGNTTTNTYDAAGNLTSTTLPGGEVTMFGRDPARTGLLVSQTDPDSKTTHYTYDSAGDRTSITTALGEKTTMGYDTTGRMTSRVDPRGNVAGANPAMYTWAYSYDGDDRPTATTDPLGNTTTTTYDLVGNKTSVTNANGAVTSYSYDAADHLTRITPPAAPTANHTDYTYDASGNMTSRTDGNGHVTTYAYDAANELQTVTDPLGRVTSYAYDLAGNPATKTDGNGHVTTYTYDALNRLANTAFGGAHPGMVYTFDIAVTYDADNNKVNVSQGAGAVTSARTYDTDNRLTGVTNTGDAGGYAYTYDPAGHITSRTYPGSAPIKYTYDSDGRMHSVTANGGTTTYGYDAAGDQTSKTLPVANGYAEKWTYDTAGRISRVTTAKGASTLTTYSYTRDADGNPTKITGTDGIVLYTYDAQDRLTQACYGTCASSSITYTYDSVGNRTTEVQSPGATTTYTYDAADEMTSTTVGSTVTNYTYDANGNQTQAGATTYQYDQNNQLGTTTNGTVETYLFYDGDGSRNGQDIHNSATNQWIDTSYLWDINNTLPMLAVERTKNNVLLRRYTYGNELNAESTPSTTYYLTTDGLGSVTGVTSATGTALIRYSYDPYGAARTTTILSTTGLPTSEPMRFAGQYLDTFGMYDLRAREYDPTAGVFQSRDPISGSTANPYGASYGYAQQRPQSLVDPAGTWAIPGWADYVAGQIATAVPGTFGTVLGIALNLDSVRRNCGGAPSYDCAFALAGLGAGVATILVAATFVATGAAAAASFALIAGTVIGGALYLLTPDAAGETSGYAAQQRALNSHGAM